MDTDMYGTHEAIIFSTPVDEARDYGSTVGDLIADVQWFEERAEAAHEFDPNAEYDAEIDATIEAAILLLSRPVARQILRVGQEILIEYGTKTATVESYDPTTTDYVIRPFSSRRPSIVVCEAEVRSLTREGRFIL